MSATPCKIVINDQTYSTTYTFKSRIKTLHKLMASDGFEDLSEKGAFLDTAMEIDKRVISCLEVGIESYDKLLDRIANALPD